MRNVLVVFSLCGLLTACSFSAVDALADCRKESEGNLSCRSDDPQCLYQRDDAVIACMVRKKFAVNDAKVTAALAEKKLDRRQIIAQDASVWHRNVIASLFGSHTTEH